MIRHSKLSLSLFGSILSFVLVSGLFTSIASADFNKNNLMDDAVFNNYSSMSANDIDNFLNTFPYSCISPNSGFRAVDPSGYNPSSGYLYGPTQLEVNNIANTTDFVTAGQVIHDAAQAYQLNPRVLLATLEKEQSLVTGRNSAGYCGNPTDSSGQNKYAAAVGYGCPDSGTSYSYTSINLYRRNGTTVTSVSSTCANSAAKAGFSQQLIHAAWLLKFSQERSLGNTDWAIIQGSWDNTDDLSACYSGPMTQGNLKTCPSGSATYYDGMYTIDGTSVHIDTGATAALYWYTPHFSGNQNFVSIYTNWFGSTENIPFQAMAEPRVMELTVDTPKIDPYSQNQIGDTYSAGTQRLFRSKVWVNNEWCLRTDHDDAAGINACIPTSDLSDNIFNYVSIPQDEQIKSMARYGCRIDIRHQIINNNDCFNPGREIVFTEKVYIIDQWYLISKANIEQGTPEIGFRDSALKTVPYKESIAPVFMTLTESSAKYDIVNKNVASGVYPAGLTRKFVALYKDDTGKEYYQTETDANALTADGFPASSLEETEFVAFADPRNLKLTKNSCKIDPFTQQTGDCFSSGLTRRFETKILFNGTWYYRTETDTDENNSLGFPASDLGES